MTAGFAILRRVRREMRFASIIFTVLALAGCCSSDRCEPERLPNKGIAATPAMLASIVNAAARGDCTNVVYDLASRRTRDKVGYLKFWAFWNTQTLGKEFGDASVADALRDAHFERDYADPDLGPNEVYGLFT